jgi:3-methylfumaryl-CoA hydratase
MSNLSPPLTAEELDDWRRYVGRAETREQLLDMESLRRYAVAVGSAREVEQRWPPIAHWAYFSQILGRQQLGPDGHPRRGEGIIPPIRLRRRMFAASSIRYLEPFELNQRAQLTTTVVDLTHKVGDSGELVFMELQRILTQHGRDRVSELQTIVYLEGNAAGRHVGSRAFTVGGDTEVWEPSTVEVFRFSAATFNAHRIHYDLPYTQTEEGYPNLVVQGPLTAAKLQAFAQTRSSKPITEFAFRIKAPIFINQIVHLRQDPHERNFEAVRCDGIVAVSARANC